MKKKDDKFSVQLGLDLVNLENSFVTEGLIQKPNTLSEYKKSDVLPREDEENVSDFIDYFFVRRGEEKLSHQMLFYDLLPKYVFGQTPERIGGVKLPKIHRTIMYNGKPVDIEIDPVSVEYVDTDKEVREKDFYPSTTEQLVEEGLRKMAADGRGKLIHKKGRGVVLVVEFYLNELSNMLMKFGKTRSYNELVDALLILRKAVFTVKSSHDDLRGIRPFNILTDLVLVTRADIMADGMTRCSVEFNSVITECILKGDIRLYNYERSMKFKNPLARWIYKRLSYRFTYAQTNRDFNLLLTTIFEESGTKMNVKMSKNRGKVINAIDELIEQKVIADYDEDVIMGGTKQNKIMNYKYFFRPSPIFIQECVYANRRKKEIDQTVDKRHGTILGCPD